MLFSYNLLGQVSLAPTPNPETGDYDFFYFDSTAAVKSVHLGRPGRASSRWRARAT